MEEKKNNKGLIIGIIIFLVICLVAIIFFMFKMTYIEDKPINDTPEDTEDTTSEFTELTKYELQDEEEKEITIGEKKLKFSYKNSKLYLDNQEISSSRYFYITNLMMIIISEPGQYGERYDFYNLEENKLTLEVEENIWYSNLKVENGNLFVTGYNSKYNHNADFIKIDNLNIETCNGTLKYTTSIDKYQTQISEHENEDIQSKYEIKYEEGKVKYEYVESIYKVKDFLNENSNLCVGENKN